MRTLKIIAPKTQKATRLPLLQVTWLMYTARRMNKSCTIYAGWSHQAQGRACSVMKRGITAPLLLLMTISPPSHMSFKSLWTSGMVSRILGSRPHWHAKRMQMIPELAVLGGLEAVETRQGHSARTDECVVCSHSSLNSKDSPERRARLMWRRRIGGTTAHDRLMPGRKNRGALV